MKTQFLGSSSKRRVYTHDFFMYCAYTQKYICPKNMEKQIRVHDAVSQMLVWQNKGEFNDI